jgi:hypothetical protein
LLQILQLCPGLEVPVATVSAVTKSIDAFLKLRRTPSRKTKYIPTTFFFMNWQDNALRKAKLREVLTSKVTQCLLPSPITDFVISRKLSAKIATKVFNYTKVARELPPPVSENPADCPCRTLFSKAFRPKGGCVRTGSMRIVALSSLRRLLSYGASFRTKQPVYDPLVAIKVCLNDYIARQDEVAKDTFIAWKTTVLDLCSKNLKASRKLHKTKHTPMFSWKDWSYLRFLQKHLVIHYTDKAANNIAFRCKSEYVRTLATELDNPAGTYERVATTEEDLVKEHERFLKPLFLFDQKCKRLGYLYIATKFHKAGQRFVAGMSKCTTTYLSKILSDVGNFVLETLRQQDDDRIIKTGIRRFFVVNGFEEVASFVHSWKFNSTDSRSLRSGDFSTMYTSLPLHQLKYNVNFALLEAWEYTANKLSCDLSEVRLVWKQGEPCVWVRQRTSATLHSGRMHSFTRQELHRLICWLVDNTFVVNAGLCRRQVIGLPMGTNCAPCLCNLCLFTWEYRYIQRLVEKGNIDEAASHHMTFRLIDDVLSIGNPFAEAFFTNCYPPSLTLNETTLADGSVNFLGMHFKDTGDLKLAVDVYDKRKDFPFKVVRYPHLDSAIPSSIPYGVFVGQLHRFKRICSSYTCFVRNACDVANTLGRQKSCFRRLKRTFSSFCRHWLSRSRWGVKVSSLICFFNDNLQLCWMGPTTRDLTRLPRTRSSVTPSGLAWLSRNFPALSQVQYGSRPYLSSLVGTLHANPSVEVSLVRQVRTESPGLF